MNKQQQKKEALDKRFDYDLCAALHKRHSVEGVTMLALADELEIDAYYLSRRFKGFGFEVLSAPAQLRKRDGRNRTNVNTITAEVQRRGYERAYAHMVEEGIRPDIIERVLSKN